MSTKDKILALVTQKDLDKFLPWENDDKHLESALNELGIKFEKPVWNDPSVDWSRYSLVIPRTTWDYAS